MAGIIVEGDFFNGRRRLSLLCGRRQNALLRSRFRKHDVENCVPRPSPSKLLQRSNSYEVPPTQSFGPRMSIDLEGSISIPSSPRCASKWGFALKRRLRKMPSTTSPVREPHQRRQVALEGGCPTLQGRQSNIVRHAFPNPCRCPGACRKLDRVLRLFSLGPTLYLRVRPPRANGGDPYADHDPPALAMLLSRSRSRRAPRS